MTRRTPPDPEYGSRHIATVALATCWTVATLSLGLFSFGGWTTLVFSFGFVGGLLLWLAVPTRGSYRRVRTPYLLTFAAFVVLHRVEENVMRFQQELSKLTGQAVPELTSPALWGLLVMSVGAWLLALPLLKRGYALGAYLAWSFFASMGITELAHFAFPLFTDGGYGYFPGMASVVILAPLAWWGMYRLARPDAA